MNRKSGSQGKRHQEECSRIDFSDKPMWDILDSQDGGIHGEGLQNRTECQVGKDQMGGESEQGERGERTDDSEMGGED